MADETTFKAQTALIADALNLMYDTQATANPMHPLRRLNRLFLYDDLTHLWAANDPYITSAYAGRFPTDPAVFDKLIYSALLELTTATVETAAADDVVLTFAEDIKTFNNVSLGGEAKTIGGIVVVDNVVTITVTAPYVAGNSITVSGNFQAVSGATLTLVDQVVTNNVV